MDLKDIKAIIDLMKKNSITEFELERQDSKIRLKRGFNGGAVVSQPDEALRIPRSMSRSFVRWVGAGAPSAHRGSALS